MIHYLLKWLRLLLVCLATPVVAQIDLMDDDASQIPQRPVNHVLDAARWFTLDEKESAGKELGRIYKENEIDVYLVTLSKQPPQGAQTYARKLGETWSRSAVWCVVFHVPGDPSGFHIEAGGIEIERESVEQGIAEASKRARKEITEKDRVIAAWKECSESLRFIHSRVHRTNERVVEVKKGMLEGENKKRRLRKIIPAIAIAGLFILAAVTYFIVRLIKARHFTFVFPATSWRTRFQAPHSGGGGIVVNYRRKRLK